MSAIYRQRVDDDRLQATVEHVRKWLFGADQPDQRADHEQHPRQRPGNRQERARGQRFPDRRQSRLRPFRDSDPKA
jgi:hypothetical protein